MSKIIDIINSNHEPFFRNEGDFYKRETHDTVSFIPKSKLDLNHLGFDEVKYRQKFKIGKLPKKLLTDNCFNDYGINNSRVEDFVNCYKSFFDRDVSKLKIISGDEILTYYHQESYFKPSGLCIGQLWKSCMRHSEKNRYMEIYSKNPSSVKMLVLLSDDNKLKCRALLWEDVKDKDGNSYKVMDRIYSIYDHDMVFFKEWAFENNYIHKYEQSSQSENVFKTPEGVKRINLRVFLENHNCSYYPYVDSFKWYSESLGTLSNTPNFNHDYELVQNDGSLYKEREEVYENEDEDYDAF